MWADMNFIQIDLINYVEDIASNQISNETGRYALSIEVYSSPCSAIW